MVERKEMNGGEILRKMRRLSPRVHCIANAAAAPDVANVLLAAGARPILAQGPEETGEIAASCSAAVLNFGTPDGEKMRAIRLAAAGAAAAGIPSIADPVGAGASSWRREQVLGIMREIPFSAIHCNYSEALVLLGQDGGFQGVDSAFASLGERIAAAERTASEYGCPVLLSGAEDVVSDGNRTWVIRGGAAIMSRVTGTGCMLSALAGAFCSVEQDRAAALSAAASFWKACGEWAWRQTEAAEGGPGTFRAKLTDAAFKLENWRENIEYTER